MFLRSARFPCCVTYVNVVVKVLVFLFNLSTFRVIHVLKKWSIAVYPDFSRKLDLKVNVKVSVK